jgi:hypothetical protein
VIFALIFDSSLSKEPIDADSIVSNYLKYKNHSIIHHAADVIIKGKIIESEGKRSDFTVYYLPEDNYRLRMDFGKLRAEIITGKFGNWSKIKGAPPLPADDYKVNTVLNFKYILNPDFIHSEEKGFTLKYDGKSEVLKIPCHKIILTDSNGITHDFFFAEEDSRLVKYTAIKTVHDEPNLFVIYFNEIKTIKGIQVPVTIESYMGDKEITFEIEDITINSGLTEYEFYKPN